MNGPHGRVSRVFILKLVQRYTDRISAVLSMNERQSPTVSSVGYSLVSRGQWDVKSDSSLSSNAPFAAEYVIYFIRTEVFVHTYHE